MKDPSKTLSWTSDQLCSEIIPASRIYNGNHEVVQFKRPNSCTEEKTFTAEGQHQCDRVIR